VFPHGEERPFLLARAFVHVLTMSSCVMALTSLDNPSSAPRHLTRQCFGQGKPQLFGFGRLASRLLHLARGPTRLREVDPAVPTVI